MLANANLEARTTRKPTVKTRRLTSEERRAAIIAAAEKLFARRGFRGTTTRELAAAVGVTEPVLYEHFKTKRELYSAIIDAKSKQACEAFQALVGPHLATEDDRGFFTGLARLILDFDKTNPDYIRLLLFSGLEGHDLAELVFERHRQNFYNVVSTYLERRMAQGALRALDPMLVGRVFIGMVAHQSLVSLLYPHARLEVSREELISGMVDVFLRGISYQKDC